MNLGLKEKVKKLIRNKYIENVTVDKLTPINRKNINKIKGAKK